MLGLVEAIAGAVQVVEEAHAAKVLVEPMEREKIGQIRTKTKNLTNNQDTHLRWW